MIPAYSPQARGRSERNFGTWQGRLPQELRLAGCTTLEASEPLPPRALHRRVQPPFSMSAGGARNAFVPCASRDLERVFSLQFERTVNRDNTVSFQNLHLQIERVKWRGTLAGCNVTAHQHLDGSLSLSFGPHCLGRYPPTAPLKPQKPALLRCWAVEATPARFQLKFRRLSRPNRHKFNP